ncbi:hypothetical protein ElyMa_000162200 [Elysia marginata]|uniref:Uncharacterized protein n=1 Tax=Elysia marginata TaxID=1093978 RepID=A0AAV4ER80_9GAST|nr:hypothetical protein ElyMa_000162200 [Elysia marginata]
MEIMNRNSSYWRQSHSDKIDDYTDSGNLGVGVDDDDDDDDDDNDGDDDGGNGENEGGDAQNFHETELPVHKANLNAWWKSNFEM